MSFQKGNKLGRANLGRKHPYKSRKPHSEETKIKISKNRKGKMMGSKNHKWKGRNVGYVALHTWIVRILGRPDVCEHCKKSGLKGHQIHWANKNGKYRRNKSDWIRLCVKCHKIYDMERIKNICLKLI